MDHLMSVHEAAERLGISSWTVYRLARNGDLPSVRLGRRRLFAVEDLDELVRKGRHTEIAACRDEQQSNDG